MISCNYIAEKLLRWLEKIRNRHNVLKSNLRHYEQFLWSWCGIEHIHLATAHERQRHKLISKYTVLKGEVGKLKIHNEFKISYDDHVSRIKTAQGYLKTAFFTRPSLSADNFTAINLEHTPAISSELHKLAAANPQLKNPPQAFCYTAMETKSELATPVCVGLPPGFADDFILNASAEITQNVLHLPIKISKHKAQELIKEGRIIKNNAAQISHLNVYLPTELSYLKPFIEYIASIEQQFNPSFLEDYYIFLSVSHSIIPPGDTQRRGGWHIDGHQGSERLQINGKKLPCDRQYLICNTNPTEYIQHTFNFDKVRAYCKQNFCSIDAVNMQDVIEYQAAQHEARYPEAVGSLPINKLVFLNPYMVHRAVSNKSDQPIKRTFVRILCSTFIRNRLGDSINPVLGPIYPVKVKTIVDVHEIPDQYK